MNMKKAKIISWVGRFIMASTFLLIFYKIDTLWCFLVFLSGLALQCYAFIYKQNNNNQ
ncbi:hypothetical protein [Bacillus sp. FJAT-29937]|uniref:hypothetical protein n=1 Tax=Bacillus sp. FJAT-29937 TaxID=1720553 RepID=UPI0012E3B66D|nr:hypothetical protein [Bacillus sp. FJAT-29937]